MQSAFTGEVRSFVVSNFLLGKEYAVSNEASFLEEGIIDSTGVLELVSYLEETYGIEITDEELNPDNLDSITKVAAFLSRKVSERDIAKTSSSQHTYSAN